MTGCPSSKYGMDPDVDLGARPLYGASFIVDHSWARLCTVPLHILSSWGTSGPPFQNPAGYASGKPIDFKRYIYNHN